MLVGRAIATMHKYGDGIALTVVAIAGRLALNPWLGESSNRHLVFLPTVMLVAWLGGLGPGLLSAALCTAALALFYTHPVGVSLDVVVFCVIASAIAGLLESLRRARMRADAAIRARDQVLEIVAHDLRNPLTTITMTASALARNPPDAEGLRKRAGAIDRSARRMDSLIRDLVAATKIESRGLELNMQDVDIDSVVRETADGFAPLASQKGLTIETSTPTGKLTVKCDRERILQVLGNLVANAVRFTPGQGRITLRAEALEDVVRFEVADTGSGIRAEDLPRIFERYWNSDSKGTGLGLYIAESLVRAHGGRIGVDTQLGVGSTFFFTLPRRAREASAGRPLGPWFLHRATGNIGAG